MTPADNPERSSADRLVGWRFDLEVVAAERLKWKYADELNRVLHRCDALNVAIEEMHQTIRDAEFPDGEYPALGMTTLVLGARLFHAARGIACLTANGHGAEARPLRRQAHEIVARSVHIFKDESGQRERAWLHDTWRAGPTKTVQASFGEDGEYLYSWLSDDAHGRPEYLGLELLRRLRDRDGVWVPLADAGEDGAAIAVTCREMDVLTTQARLVSRRVESGDPGALLDLVEIGKSWARDSTDDGNEENSGSGGHD